MILHFIFAYFVVFPALYAHVMLELHLQGTRAARGCPRSRTRRMF
jgi:hypothetical protein